MSDEMDIATIAHLHAELDALLSNHPTFIEVDLSAVTFLSCAAAETLRHAHLRAPDH